MKIIVMAGGSGSRLWPLSRIEYPKQFLKLPGMIKSIFQMTIERCLLIGNIDDIYLVTGEKYHPHIIKQLDELNLTLPAEQILLEPEAKNTLPAIMFAVQAIKEKGEDICAVFASDHVIDHPEKFVKTLIGATGLANKGFVCFGITPTGPEIGFGYIKPGIPVHGGFEIDEFKEKPDHDTACEYIKNGYLWNSGIFMFRTDIFYESVKQYNPEVFEAFKAKSIEERFAKTPAISVDYGLIEKMETVYGAPFLMEWNDIGNFTTLYDRYHSKQDDNGNVFFHDEVMLDSNNNLVYSEGDKAIALIGLSDLVVIDQKDALLVCKREQSSKVKDVVDILKSRNDIRANQRTEGG